MIKSDSYFDNEYKLVPTEDAVKYVGRKIKKAVFDGTGVRLTFDDDVTIYIWDSRQSCCEHRYMETTDNVSRIEGQTLVSIAERPADDVETDYGVHEVVFLEIQTDKDVISFSTHNEHNGYYGGFSLVIKEETK